MEEDSTNKKERKRTKDRSPSPGVKSTAVVKYTAFESPVSYARLQCNTDLNMPPSNWIAAIDSYGLKQILTGETGFSSFRMANMFPDCVGEVDVISGAECIKKLLKLPYQPNGTISMVVHRVENTLLLDDFDIYDYLMKTEWAWLKDFFYENVLKTMNEKERMALMLPPPSPNSTLQLTHKFLSHSVAEPAELENKLEVPSSTPICIAGPFLPEPEPRAEQPPNEHLYNRNVLWTFEDIQMLIGSDLPIFGDEDRPCVSLRLRDAREPINVLTGIDYWLDNLMCNVPEVLMCYHLDGIVQKYEPMKTEDLPNLENSKFSPKVIRNVAQNILSFLKSNVTKAGHTYWLFKGPHDDVVKLYDLTSLCPDSVDNPFTTPVAMLLYRVARNMRLSERGGDSHVRRLLQHVVALLCCKRHPHIAASARYMLADIYLPARTDPAKPDFKDESSDSEEEENEECQRCGAEDFVSGNGVSEKNDTNDRSADKEQISKDDDVPSTSVDTTAESSSKRDITDTNMSERDANSKQNASESNIEEDANNEDALAVQIRGLALHDIGDRIRDTRTRKKRKMKTGKGLGNEPPDRCGKALQHALEGLKALHNVTISKCKEEERERLKQQIINEEQHPKMANPYEPIRMDYEPLNTQKGKEKGKGKETKEHKSKNKKRKNKKNQESREHSKNYLIESKPTIDKNAILVRKEKNVFSSLQEPNRDDSFAWKLHLKTLLYEKICLAYVTLAEYSYAHEQYGFSLKYVHMASICQKLLSNMIIKSKVVDASCLFGRVGDNYFQLSKNWHKLEKFKKQFVTDHEIDKKIKSEIEKDFLEECEDDKMVDEFNLTVHMPESEKTAMTMSVEAYRTALHGAASPDELRRRLASVLNEYAVRLMNDAHCVYSKYADDDDKNSSRAKLQLRHIENMSRKSRECLDEACEIFESVKDSPNLALLYCNRARYLRFRAYCDESLSPADITRLYSEGESLYQRGLKLLGARDTCGASSVWDLVCWELSCHLYNRAVNLQECPEGVTASDVADAFKHALKHCLLSPGPRQYLYQFRAAMIHHKLGSLYHSQYRSSQEEGARRRTLCSAVRAQYVQAANMFAALEDVPLHLTVQLEHVALLERQADMLPNLKLKSLQDAVQVLRQCHSVMKLIKNRDPEEQPSRPEEQGGISTQDERSLLELYKTRLHHILKSIIQYCISKSNKDYDKMTDVYKKLYSASLRIQNSNDVRKFAESICIVLEAMDAISLEF